MDDRLGRTLETYERNAERYAWQNADRSSVDALLETFLDGLDGDRVLDVGCGPGWETARMAAAGLDVVGIDMAAALLAEARDSAPAVEFARADVRSIPLESDSVDGVWACASLLHVPREQLSDALAELSRVLRTGGRFVATVKSDSYEDRTDDYDGERHFEYYEADEFGNAVETACFDVEALTEFESGWLRLRARGR